MGMKCAFRNALKEDSLEQWIRKMLELHDPANIDELCRETGCARSEISSSLNALVGKGEVERLRPWKYDREDLDYFRLPGPLRRPKYSQDGNRWQAIRRLFSGLFCNTYNEGNMEHCL